MASNCVLDKIVGSLPIELWCNVFQHLEPRIDPKTGHWLPSLEAQAYFWQLPRVCKAFQRVFKALPRLGCQAVLKRAALKSPNKALATSLVPWLQARAAVLQRLCVECWAPDVVKFLRALKHPDSTLSALHFEARYQAEICTLASFTSLTSCSLKSTYAGSDMPDLQPLQGLPHLTHVSLENGEFTTFSAASHLTRLELRFTQVTNAVYCNFASSLVDLYISDGDLVGLHARGLLACTALQRLEIWDHCSSNAANQADAFQCCSNPEDDEDDHWPADMSPLACLTDLRVRLREGSGGVNLTGVATLTSLTILFYFILFGGPIIVGPMMENLHKLVCLELAQHARFNHGSDFDLRCDWRGYHVLQKLRIEGLFKADNKLLGLVQLPHLRNVLMRNATPADHASAFFLGSLSTQMALKRRGVKFQCMYADFSPEVQCTA
ncbi:TPA: hypothetical protein ACH3X3_008627 [Trebouxia sp. C0006]